MSVNSSPPVQLSPDLDKSMTTAFINENFRKLTDAVNLNALKIVDILEYEHTIVTGDLVNNWIQLTIPHGLDFIPTVISSFTNDIDDKQHPMPFSFFSTTSYFNTYAPSAMVNVSSVDDTNITVDLVPIDVLGLSYLAGSNTVKFKFYLLQETMVDTI